MRIESLELMFGSEAEFIRALGIMDQVFAKEVNDSLETCITYLPHRPTVYFIKFTEPILVGHFQKFISIYNEQK